MAENEEMFDPDNVDTYKHTHESSTEWNLRREFLLANHSTLPPDRLFCLASCFINVECYGCRYPAGVMNQLRELAHDLKPHIDAHRQQIQKQRDLKFVKAGGGQEQQGNAEEPASSSLTPLKQSQSVRAYDRESKCAVKSRQNPDHKMKFGSKSNEGELKAMKFVKPESQESSQEFIAEEEQVKGTESQSDLKSAFTALASAMQPQNQQQKPQLQPQNTDDMDQGFYGLASHVRELKEHAVHKKKNAVEIIHLALDKCQMSASTKFVDPNSKGKFCCELCINCVRIARGEAANKRTAKHEAFETALKSLLMHPYLHVVQLGQDERELLSSTAPFDGVPTSPPVAHSSGSLRSKLISHTGITKLGAATEKNIHTLAKSNVHIASKQELHELHTRMDHHAQSAGSVHSRLGKRPSQTQTDLSDFLIIEPKVKSDGTNAVSILNQSAAFNKVCVDYDFRDEPLSSVEEPQVRCCLRVEGQLLANVATAGKQAAKALAAGMGLDRLRQTCWTIQVKKTEDTDELGLSRDEVLGTFAKVATTSHIPDSNIGSKLLQKMGWSGGGVGKEGNKGITEPVSVTSVVNREGLGLSAEEGLSADFDKHVREIVENYTRSNRQDDLMFSPDFTKSERAVIHKECQKLGLKTHSHGKGDQRYLVVSRKRTANQLFSHILQQGGETSRYHLVPPGTIKQEV